MNDIDNEAQEIAQMNYETMCKYKSLNIKPNHEAKLKRMYAEEESKFILSIVRDEKFTNNMILRHTKPELAKLIFFYNQDCQDLKIGLLCHTFGLSSSYYREIKAINKVKWLEEYLTMREESFIYHIVEANDNTVSDSEYILRQGKGYDRTRWKV